MCNCFKTALYGHQMKIFLFQQPFTSLYILLECAFICCFCFMSLLLFYCYSYHILLFIYNGIILPLTIQEAVKQKGCIDILEENKFQHLIAAVQQSSCIMGLKSLQTLVLIWFSNRIFLQGVTCLKIIL